MDKRNKRLFSVIVFLFVVGAFIWQLKISDRQAKLGEVGAKEETGNALYIGQIEKHYCSRESAVEVNGILKYLELTLRTPRRCSLELSHAIVTVCLQSILLERFTVSRENIQKLLILIKKLLIYHLRPL